MADSPASTAAPGDVAVVVYLRSGPDLVAESNFAVGSEATIAVFEAGSDGIDGGLDIRAGSTVLSWPDVWDRVDGMLAAWIAALDDVLAGADESVAVFPDTRVECEISRVGDINVHIEYEDVSATVGGPTLRAALLAAASRLVALAAGARETSPALQSLAARLAKETQG